jgi:hypothetical protein
MTIRQRIVAFGTRPGAQWGLYALLAVAASLIAYAWGGQATASTHFNNYLIFKTSFPDLLAGRDLYVTHAGPHYDLYKYSPVFALSCGVFVAMPDWLGLLLWNLLNAGVLFSAIRAIPRLSEGQKAFVVLFVALELLTNMQNAQSNGLMAGLMIRAHNGLEGGRVGRAALFVALAAFLKPFGLVAAALFVLYPRRTRFCLALAGWAIVLAVLPVVATPPRTLLMQYASWYAMLQADYARSLGLSVAGGLEAWLGLVPDKRLVALTGAALFGLAYLNRRAWEQPGFRLLLLASVLVWAVIFNHKAESPTFVIAVSGVGLWYVAQRRNTLDLVLLLFVFVLTSLSPTDLFPAGVRSGVILHWRLKALPCILVWVKILYDQLAFAPSGPGRPVAACGE